MMYSHWVHFLFDESLSLSSSLLTSLVPSNSIQDSSIASYIISLLKLFKSIFLPRSVKSVTHQVIFISPKDIPTWLTGLLDFNWQHSLIALKFQYITMSCVSYLSSASIWTCSVMKTRVSWSILVKIFFGNKSCGESVGGLCYASSDSDTGAYTTCKVNICKKSYFVLSPFASHEYGCLVRLPTAPSTIYGN